LPWSRLTLRRPRRFFGARILARACRHLSQASAHTRCSPARKFRAVFS
jgi:hypothetical protein